MKLEEVAGVKIWRRRQLSEMEEVADVLRLEDASVQNLDDHLFEMKHFVDSMPKQTTNPTIATSLSLPLT